MPGGKIFYLAADSGNSATPLGGFLRLDRPLVLASRSPRRAAILEILGLPHERREARIDESTRPGETAAGAVERLAVQKCLAVSRTNKDGITLGFDTVVELDGDILGKPRDRAHALDMLRRLNGRDHRVHTGVALCAGGKVAYSGGEWVQVSFRRVPDGLLRAYAEGDEPLDKAGAYAIQGRGAFLVRSIRGCVYCALGVPIDKTLRALMPYTPWALSGESTA